MPDHPDLDAPITLTGLFPSDDDDDSDNRDRQLLPQQGAHHSLEHNPEGLLTFEVQSLTVASRTLQVRQFDYHSHNANRVWPGALNLAEYLLLSATKNKIVERDQLCSTRWGNVLELGTATGLLAIRLALNSSVHHPKESSFSSPDESIIYCCDEIVTSDVQDEDGIVARNLHFNYDLNGFDQHRRRPRHVPHTWGSGWSSSVQQAQLQQEAHDSDRRWELPRLDTVIASDILLYVNAYPALVQTLCEIIPESSRTCLVMSWNRRMKASREFFDRMNSAGFDDTHEGKCIYTFRRRRRVRP